MAKDLNSCDFIGRLTKEPELKYIPSGTAVSNLSIAVNDRVKKNDAWVDEVSFFDLTLWGKTAESLQQYLKKGTQIGVECKAKQQRWEQDGKTRSKVCFVVQSLQLLGGKSDGQTNSAPQPQQNGSNGQNTANQSNNGQTIPDDFDDDIPF